MILLVSLALARPASIGSVDSGARALRCHWQRPEHADLCAEVLGWAELAWTVQVEQIGFATPIADGGEGGSDAVDIYLTLAESGEAGVAWVDCDGGDPNCIDADPADGRAAASSYVVIDARTEAADIPGYTVHEFNHVLQYATDYAEPFLSVWEGTAVSAEAWTLADRHPSAGDIADYQATPWASAVLQDGYFLDDAYGLYTWYEYGAMVWVQWLDHAYGDGAGSIGPALWAGMTQEGYAYEPDVLDAWDAFAPWQESFLRFTADRGRMGTADAPGWIAWAGEDARVWFEAEDVSLPAELRPEWPVFPLGASFFSVSASGSVRVRLEGDAATEWGIVATDGAREWTTTGGELEVSGPVTVAVVNLGPVGMDADDALEAATFTLTLEAVEAVAKEPGGCGCGTGGGGRAAWAVALALAVGRRQSAFGSRPTPTRKPPSSST